MSVLHMARPAMEKSIEWRAWKGRWNRARDLPTRLGLLHSSFGATTTSPDERAERICLLMAVANHRDGVWDSYDSEWHECAKKAFAVLYEHVIHNNGIIQHIDRHPSYIDPKVLEAFFELFTCNPGRLSASVVENFMMKQVTWFIERVCDCVWEGGREHFLPYKPAVVEMLHAHGLLNRVLNKWERFDDASLSKLETISLRDHPTIEEAVYAGSHAARALLIVRTALTELERRNKRVALERQVAQGQQALAEL